MSPRVDSRPLRIAFIGTGVMGAPMAGHLLAAGHELRVHTRSPSRAAALLEAGARWADSPSEAMEDAEATITIVGYPEDVRALYLEGQGGAPGLVEAAAPGSLLIDMTTSRPSLAREIAATAEARGVAALDAPVSGGDVGARAGSLSIMVGASEAAFDRALPLLSAMGGTIVRQGPPGAGQHCKMCNQIAIAGTMIGAMEALLYARRAGLDPEVVLASIGAGAAGSWTLRELYPRVVRGDLGPGFFVKHFVKDLRIARDEAASLGLRLPGLALALALYERLQEEGGGDLGTQALYRVLEAESTD